MAARVIAPEEDSADTGCRVRQRVSGESPGRVRDQVHPQRPRLSDAAAVWRTAGEMAGDELLNDRGDRRKNGPEGQLAAQLRHMERGRGASLCKPVTDLAVVFIVVAGKR